MEEFEMENRQINHEQIKSFALYLRCEERADGTIEKYLRDVRTFSAFAAGRSVTKEIVAAWKEQLIKAHYAPATVNSMLAAVHSFFAFMEWPGCQVKYLKVQRRLFRDPGKELGREDYERLIAAASERGQKRLALLIETICATGIRVSEVKFITLEAVMKGKAEVSLKGKIRTILIPGKLARKLIKYAKKQKIASGEIFLTKNGTGISRCQIWAEMKRLCKYAGVDSSKVFPHNLRHLFARVFYKSCKDIVRLADVLGHSSIETTRIYLLTTVAEYTQHMNRLGLVS